MALRNYLVGEVAEDFVDGLLSRREALRRLTLLGLSVNTVRLPCWPLAESRREEGVERHRLRPIRQRPRPSRQPQEELPRPRRGSGALPGSGR